MNNAVVGVDYCICRAQRACLGSHVVASAMNPSGHVPYSLRPHTMCDHVVYSIIRGYEVKRLNSRKAERRLNVARRAMIAGSGPRRFV